MSKPKSSLKGIIDTKVLGISGVICLIFILWVAIWPDSAGPALSNCLNFFTTQFGWLYLIIVTAFVGFLFWLCFSKFGKITLGKDGEKPRYSTRSWFFMLFSAGMGIGLVFWSVAEPLSHMIAPPTADPGTIEAARDAMRLSFMHWGLHPWACFGVVGLALGYWQFRKGKPALISSTLIPLYGEKGALGPWGKTVDILAVFATVFGVATSLGLGAMQINSGLNYVFNIPYGNLPMVLIIVVITILFVVTAVSGIERGINWMANANMTFMFLLLAFVLIVGPTVFILNFITESVGTYFFEIIPQSFWADSFGQTDNWLGGWTVFYWGWWISWGPFVGGFIARISRGRTVREFIFGALLAPVLLSFLFIGILGGAGINFEFNGVTAIAEAMSESSSFALFALLQQFPIATVTSLIAIFLIATFFITSANSSTFVCSMLTSYGVQNPPKGLRIFWGAIEGGVAIVLLFVGGLSALQTASIVAAFPFMIVCVLMMIATVKVMSQDIASGGVPMTEADKAEMEAEIAALRKPTKKEKREAAQQ